MSLSDTMADVAARAKSLEGAYNSGDLNRIFEYFAENATFSDYVLGIRDLNKAQTRAFYTDLYAKHKNLAFTTRAVSGSDELMAWELDISFEAGAAIEPLGIAAGEQVVFQGVSLTRWVEGKIEEEKDYFFLLSHK